jgi:hypothetical protein
MVVDAGVTDTDATGGGVTMTVAEPVIPSLAALIVAVPGLIPDTTPESDVVATSVFELCHVTTRPVSTAPLASLMTAVARVDWRVAIVDALKATVIDATGTLLMTRLALALCPSEVAVMLTVPTAKPRTTPESDTLARSVSELFQVTTRSSSAVPAPSRGVAVNRTVRPTNSDAFPGAISILVTLVCGNVVGPFGPYTLGVAESGAHPLTAATRTGRTMSARI